MIHTAIIDGNSLSDLQILKLLDSSRDFPDTRTCDLRIEMSPISETYGSVSTVFNGPFATDVARLLNQREWLIVFDWVPGTDNCQAARLFHRNTVLFSAILSSLTRLEGFTLHRVGEPNFPLLMHGSLDDNDIQPTRMMQFDRETRIVTSCMQKMFDSFGQDIWLVLDSEYDAFHETTGVVCKDRFLIDIEYGLYLNLVRNPASLAAKFPKLFTELRRAVILPETSISGYIANIQAGVLPSYALQEVPVAMTFDGMGMGVVQVTATIAKHLEPFLEIESNFWI